MARRASKKAAGRRNGRPRASSGPRRRVAEERPHLLSGTAVAAEALRTGLLPLRVRRVVPAPRDADTLRVGDPDDDAFANEYVGEDTPGGSTPTPDQSNVDEIGRAYGLQEEDTGALRSGAEVLARRDRHRAELIAPRRPRP